MKPMLFGFLAIAVIAVGANLVLDQMGWSSGERGASSNSVRLE